MKRTLGILVAIIFAVGGAYIGKTVTTRVIARLRAPTELTNWRTQSIAHVLLDAPGDLKSDTLDFGAARQLMDSSEYYTLKTRGFEVGVIRCVFKPDAQLNIDGAAAGTVDNVSKLEGVRNLQHTTESQTISEKPARKISINADRWNGRIYNDNLVILDGQTMYEVETSYDSTNPKGAAYSQRVIGSVKIVP